MHYAGKGSMLSCTLGIHKQEICELVFPLWATLCLLTSFVKRKQVLDHGGSFWQSLIARYSSSLPWQSWVGEVFNHYLTQWGILSPLKALPTAMLLVTLSKACHRTTPTFHATKFLCLAVSSWIHWWPAPSLLAFSLAHHPCGRQQVPCNMTCLES